jgi:hypothetical protein
MKISASDIRPGNYHKGIKINLVNQGVYSINIDGIYPEAITQYGISIVDKGEMDFEPILLSEGWFDAFGFSRMDCEKDYKIRYESDISDINDYDLREIEIFWNEDDCWSVIFENRYLRSIEYVHELQNLFYWLSKQELTINTAKS